MSLGDKSVPTTTSTSTETLKPEPPSSSAKTSVADTKDTTKEKAPLSRTTAQPSSPPNPSSSTRPNGQVEPEASTDEIINMDIFNQILELDDDDTHDFSREMVEEYYTQAAQTFDDMDAALTEKDLVKLSDLGHFLKGSSATLGITHVQSSCEKIQRYGQLRDEEKGIDLNDKQALDLITQLIAQVKVEYSVAEKWMKNWYKEQGDKGPSE